MKSRLKHIQAMKDLVQDMVRFAGGKPRHRGELAPYRMDVDLDYIIPLTRAIWDLDPTPGPSVMGAIYRSES